MPDVEGWATSSEHSLIKEGICPLCMNALNKVPDVLEWCCSHNPPHIWTLQEKGDQISAIPFTCPSCSYHWFASFDIEDRTVLCPRCLKISDLSK